MSILRLSSSCIEMYVTKLKDENHHQFKNNMCINIKQYLKQYKKVP